MQPARSAGSIHLETDPSRTFMFSSMSPVLKMPTGTFSFLNDGNALDGLDGMQTDKKGDGKVLFSYSRGNGQCRLQANIVNKVDVGDAKFRPAFSRSLSSQGVRRNIVVAQPLYAKGTCTLYLYTRSMQEDKACKSTCVDATTYMGENHPNHIQDPFVKNCCVAVHHHVEVTTCDNQQSLKLKAGMPDNAKLLKLGHDATTVFHSYARRISGMWRESLSPKMGMAVDQQFIYTLGGVPLSLKQYHRMPGADGVHTLVATYLQRLCVPRCEGRGCPKGPKGCKTWDGQEYNCYCNCAMSHRPVGLSSNQALEWVKKYHHKAEHQRLNAMDESAGGHLVVQLGADGVADRVYGIAHCGTVFMAELKKRRSVVLQHVQETFSHWRVEVGIALQRYRTPLGVVSNLFLSVSKAYLKRFSLNNIRTKKYPEVQPGNANKVNKYRWNRFMSTSGFSTDSARIIKLPINAALSSKRCHKFTLNRDGDVTSAWAGTVPLTATKTCQILAPMAEVFNAETIQYHAGSLLWYANGQINRLKLDIALPCDKLHSIFGKLPPAGPTSILQWCNGSGPMRRCKSMPHKPFMLLEGHERLPWTMALYKRSFTGKWDAGSTKTLICTQPTKPTTRHSPENCCEKKLIKSHGSAEHRDLHAHLL